MIAVRQQRVRQREEKRKRYGRPRYDDTKNMFKKKSSKEKNTEEEAPTSPKGEPTSSYPGLSDVGGEIRGALDSSSSE